MRKLGLGVGVLVGLACGAPTHPGELGSDYVLTPDAGVDAPALDLTPVVAPSDDPTTCAEAATLRSYVGCDYWPTVVANPVWSIFDYAVVVANAGTVAASVAVTGPGGVNVTQTVAPNGLTKIYLPWVTSLKGEDSDVCGGAPYLSTSVFAPRSAYHLVSSVPVTVYQFNALEYRPVGGPAGKDWSACPGLQTCTAAGGPQGCFSYTNDSSLLLPSTAMTGHYRVTGYSGATLTPLAGPSVDIMNGYFAITGTVDGTHVKVQLSSSGHVVTSVAAIDGGVTDDAGTDAPAGDDGGPIVVGADDVIPDAPGGRELELTLNAGDVVELASPPGATSDVSGSLVAADQPVQVIAGTPCSEVPSDELACDHLEQSVFPAETLGKRYFVTAPTGPVAVAVGREVRIYGNVDDTVLTYAPSLPGTCPTTIDAGQVATCGIVTGDFEVTGTSEFAVGSFMQGGSIVDPLGGLGDPSESLMASVEQYRTKYVFLAPNDYTESFVDVVAPIGAAVVLDGTALVTTGVRPIADGYGVARVSLTGISAGGGGAHVLTASQPIGAQVLGYGQFTSYQYPAGLNLKQIAPPPPNPP